jgi:hypothetical protein
MQNITSTDNYLLKKINLPEKRRPKIQNTKILFK